MRFVFSHHSFEKLGRLDKGIQSRILLKLKFYSGQKNPLKFAKRLKDRKLGQFSFRIGDHRAIFDYDHGMISIVEIDKRDKVYK